MLDAHNNGSGGGPGRLNAGEVAGKGGVHIDPRGQRREGIAKNKERKVDPQGRRLIGERSNNTENRWRPAGLRDSVEKKEVWIVPYSFFSSPPCLDVLLLQQKFLVYIHDVILNKWASPSLVS